MDIWSLDQEKALRDISVERDVSANVYNRVTAELTEAQARIMTLGTSIWARKDELRRLVPSQTEEDAKETALKWSLDA